MSKNLKLANNINTKIRNPPLNENPSGATEPVETKNRYAELESVDFPAINRKETTKSLKKKVTAKQNVINTVNQNIQNSNDRSERETSDKKKLPVTVVLGDFMVKGWKMSSRARKSRNEIF